ncbi:efflux RND transporter periplasmic adaptor subunit [Thermodesulfobacteriota bacterium]
MKIIKVFIYFVIVIVILGLGFVGKEKLKASKPQLKRQKPVSSAPTVRGLTVKKSSHSVIIRDEGTVQASKQISIVPQVSGKVTYVSPGLVNGGQFQKDEVLIRVDPMDYQLAVTLAEAKVKDSESKLFMAREETAAAREEWHQLHVTESGPGKEPPPLAAKEPQLAAAMAKVEADRTDLKKALLNLERTEITAPFDGYVSQENVDIGQYVSPGQSLASIYSDESVEIILPMEDKDLFWFHVPGLTPGSYPGSRATVKANFGGRDLSWSGEVVRAWGKIDERTRMVNVVVQVMNPFDRKPPLALGLFVTVEIKGRVIEDSAMIPRSVLHQDNIVWVVDEESRLRFRKLEVARFDGNHALIRSGLNEGDRVVKSPLSVVTDGMKVKLEDGGGIAIAKKQDHQDSAFRSADQIISDIKKRLTLTFDQEEKARPIMLMHMEQQRAIVKKYAGKGRLAMRNIGKEMMKLSGSTIEELKGFLTEKQIEEYLKFQGELREKRREAMRPRFK